jgi:hypothetical protein
MPAGAQTAAPAVPGPLTVLQTVSDIMPYHNDWAEPTVTRNAAGRSVVTWQAYDSDGINHTMAQAFNADGTAAGAPFAVGTRGFAPSVAMDAEGDFVIAWRDDSTGSSPSVSVTLQRYNPAGDPQGAPITVRTFSAPSLNAPSSFSVGMDDDGDFAVAWTEVQDVALPLGTKLLLREGSNSYIKLYNAKGTVIRPATRVDQVAPRWFFVSYHDNPFFNANVIDRLAMNGSGRFVIVFDVWRHAVQQAAAARVFGRDGTPGGDLLTLDGRGAFDGAGIDSEGNFAVAWENRSLYVSRYAADGSSLGMTGPIAAADPSGSGERGTMSMAPNGDFTATWGVYSGSPNASFVKYGQYFHADGTANGASFVIDDGSGQQNNRDMATGMDGNGNLLAVWSTLPQNQTGDIVSRTVTPPQP